MNGGAGSDYLNGGPGIDLLLGGKGNDFLVGQDWTRPRPWWRGHGPLPAEGGGNLPLGRLRPSLLALVAITVALAAASTSSGSSCARNGCTPIVRTLERRPRVTTARCVYGRGLGAFGRGRSGPGDAIFNRPESFTPLGTTYTSNLYLSAAGRMLVDDCVSGEVESSRRTR